MSTTATYYVKVAADDARNGMANLEHHIGEVGQVQLDANEVRASNLPGKPSTVQLRAEQIRDREQADGARKDGVEPRPPEGRGMPLGPGNIVKRLNEELSHTGKAIRRRFACLSLLEELKKAAWRRRKDLVFSARHTAK